MSLMRSLITMCSTLKPLPPSRILDIEVQYYKDITPRNYQPNSGHRGNRRWACIMSLCVLSACLHGLSPVFVPVERFWNLVTAQIGYVAFAFDS